MTNHESPVSINHNRLAAVARKLGLRMVVLFGSRATGRTPPDPESDVDIAVSGCPEGRFLECYNALSEVFHEEVVDMVRLEDADPLFRHEIMQAGVLLYGEPDLFYEYRAYAYRDFVDSADLFAVEDALFRKKMAYIKQQLGLHYDNQ